MLYDPVITASPVSHPHQNSKAGNLKVFQDGGCSIIDFSQSGHKGGSILDRIRKPSVSEPCEHCVHRYLKGLQENDDGIGAVETG